MKQKIIILRDNLFQLLLVRLRILLVQLIRRRGQNFWMLEQRFLYQFLNACLLGGRQSGSRKSLQRGGHQKRKKKRVFHGALTFGMFQSAKQR